MYEYDGEITKDTDGIYMRRPCLILIYRDNDI
jgi:hypothetical protein